MSLYAQNFCPHCGFEQGPDPDNPLGMHADACPNNYRKRERRAEAFKDIDPSTAVEKAARWFDQVAKDTIKEPEPVDPLHVNTDAVILRVALEIWHDNGEQFQKPGVYVSTRERPETGRAYFLRQVAERCGVTQARVARAIPKGGQIPL